MKKKRDVGVPQLNHGNTQCIVSILQLSVSLLSIIERVLFARKIEGEL